MTREVVVEINDKLYKRLFDNGVDNYDDAVDMAKAIRKGIPLPKGHGKLVDIDLLRDQVSHDEREAFSKHQVWLLLSAHNKNIPTILDADEAYKNRLHISEEDYKNNIPPQEHKCKDCKWWKDSDGAYRRGVRAESQCPINRREVFEGNGYCYLFEPQEDNKGN